MWTRRNNFLCLLFLPAIGYTFVIYILIGRTCSDEYSTEADYVSQDSSHRRVLTKSKFVNVEKSGEIFVPYVSETKQTSNRIGMSENDRVYNNGDLPSEGRHYYSPRHRPVFLFNCTNIGDIKVKKKIGHGVSKQTFLGEYGGRHVAVKMVTRHIHDVKMCLDKVKPDEPNTAVEKSKCYMYSTMKLMKEILLSEQLQHRNMAQLLGYCVRSEESDSTDIAEHGVVSVFELGSRFVMDSLQILPWPVRLRHAIEMADLLDYLHHSPLGSLVIPDFKEGHFVQVNSSLKLIDLDDINNIEPSCGAASVSGDRTPCAFGVTCQKALCIGFNAKENLKNMNRLIFKRLLFPLTFPEQVVKDIGQLNAQLDSLSLTAAQLLEQLRSIERRAVSTSVR